MYLIRQLLHQFTQYMPHTLYNNFVHVRSIVMIHKYGTAYPSLQQVNSLWLYICISQVGGKDFTTIAHIHLLSGFIKCPSDSIII